MSLYDDLEEKSEEFKDDISEMSGVMFDIIFILSTSTDSYDFKKITFEWYNLYNAYFNISNVIEWHEESQTDNEEEDYVVVEFEKIKSKIEDVFNNYKNLKEKLEIKWDEDKVLYIEKKT